VTPSNSQFQEFNHSLGIRRLSVMSSTSQETPHQPSLAISFPRLLSPDPRRPAISVSSPFLEASKILLFTGRYPVSRPRPPSGDLAYLFDLCLSPYAIFSLFLVSRLLVMFDLLSLFPLDPRSYSSPG